MRGQPIRADTRDYDREKARKKEVCEDGPEKDSTAGSTHLSHIQPGVHRDLLTYLSIRGPTETCREG